MLMIYHIKKHTYVFLSEEGVIFVDFFWAHTW
jgi:hypothetical protein